MRHLIATNISWLYKYFDMNKSLLEIFSFLMVAQSFIYSSDLKDISMRSVSAFKIVLWVMIFLVVLLLQISTAVELQNKNGQIRGIIFEGANFMKIFMQLLTLVLLIATVPIFIRQVQASLHNSLFSVFYISLGLIALLELFAFAVTKILPTKSA
jgi:hypothetical protein